MPLHPATPDPILGLVATLLEAYQGNKNITESLCTGLKPISQLLSCSSANLYLYNAAQANLMVAGSYLSSSDPSFTLDESQLLGTFQGLKSVGNASHLSIPLRWHQDVYGAIQLNLKVGHQHQAEDFLLADLLGQAFGFVLHQFHNGALAIGSKVPGEAPTPEDIEYVASLNNEILPNADDLEEITGLCIRGSKGSGDSYDYFEIAPGEIGLFICDSSAHGETTLQLNASVKALARSGLQGGDELQTIAERINQALLSFSSQPMAHCLIGRWHQISQTLEYLSFGDITIVAFDDEGQSMYSPSKHPALGIEQVIDSPSPVTLTLGGGCLYIASNGLNDVKAGQLENSRRFLEEFAIRHAHDDIQKQLVNLEHQVCQEYPQCEDDFAVLLIKSVSQRKTQKNSRSHNLLPYASFQPLILPCVRQSQGLAKTALKLQLSQLGLAKNELELLLNEVLHQIQAIIITNAQSKETLYFEISILQDDHQLVLSLSDPQQEQYLYPLSR